MRTTLMLVGTMIAIHLSSAAALHAADMKGWKVIGNTQFIQPKQQYSLLNTDQGAYLQEQDRSGANLGWTSSANWYMRVERLSDTARGQDPNRPIKCGEPFALFIEKEWVIYDRQTTGINLSTRTSRGSTDAFKWVFTECPYGIDMPVGPTLALRNIAANDALVGCKRTWGVNLCWSRDVVTVGTKNFRAADFPGLRGAISKGEQLVNAIQNVQGQMQLQTRGVDQPTDQPDELPAAAEQAKWRQEKLEELMIPPAVLDDTTAAEPITVIALAQAAHFTTPEGTDVAIQPGRYEVTAVEPNRLHLRSLTSDEAAPPVTLTASPIKLSQQVSVTIATVSLPTPDEPTILWVNPDGSGLEAVGSYTGVRSREPKRTCDEKCMAELQRRLQAYTQQVVTLKSVADSKGQVQGELQRFR